MKLAACVLLVLAIGQAAAWDCPGGVKGADTVTGSSPFFGIHDEDKPMKYIDQVAAWKKFGPITKVNFYYSWSHNCLQGVKVTYGYDSRNSQMLGVQRGLSEKHLALAPYEVISKVEVKEAGGSKCIDWIALYTNTTNSLSVGKSEAPALVADADHKEGFLAAIRGYEDFYPGQAVTKGGLQQLQLVWGVAVCPEPGREGPPAAPLRPSPDSRETPRPTDGPNPEQEPEAEPAGGGLCPPSKDKCDEAAPPGSGSYCPAVAPFAGGQCTGGCCVSSGKCKKGFCNKVGLGAEVMAKDIFCWGTNKGLLNRINKCRNLACKLAVPGCVSDLISGACVGSVVALSGDVDEGAKQWVGYPCLQTVPGGLPVDALGKWDLDGAYAAKLWSICNCRVQRSAPGYTKSTCKGPLCEILKRPELPSLSFALPAFAISDLERVIDVAPFKEDLGGLFSLGGAGKTGVDLRRIMTEMMAHLNGSLPTLSPEVKAAMSHPSFPTFSLNMTSPGHPTLSINLAAPAVNASALAAEAGQAAAGKTALRGFDVSLLGLSDIPALEGVVRALNARHGAKPEGAQPEDAGEE